MRRLGVGKDFVHVTHNPVGGAALESIRQLCFAEVNKNRLVGCGRAGDARPRLRSVWIPPFLGGDRLQIEAHLAAFRELGLWSKREDLLTALIAAMRRGHEEACAALGGDRAFRRVFLTGGGATTVRQLLPSYDQADVRLVEHGSLRGVARLFPQ